MATKTSEFFPLPEEPVEAELLLREWALWWETTDDAPVKMPLSLHIRTAMYFMERSL